jgi:hypothetical protein
MATWNNLIFDWRKFEQDGDLTRLLPDFVPPDLRTRYDEEVRGWKIVGRDAWRELVADLPKGESASTEAAFRVLDVFYGKTSAIALSPTPKPTCVFISHQRADTHRGERVACLLDHFGLNCWLDVHDPTLAAVNRLPLNDPRRSVLIAATIEIALLNSTHVIALHSQKSKASRWVPYEFGRAKSHSIVSSQAAGWFEGNPAAESWGDYVLLAVETRTEQNVLNWVQTEFKRPPVSVAATCSQHGTNELN